MWDDRYITLINQYFASEIVCIGDGDDADNDEDEDDEDDDDYENDEDDENDDDDEDYKPAHPSRRASSPCLQTPEAFAEKASEHQHLLNIFAVHSSKGYINLPL